MTPNAEVHARNLAVLERLREAARRRGTRPPAPVEAKDYDWTRPQRFTPDEAARLETLAHQVAERLGGALAALLRTEISFRPSPVRQRYARVIRADDVEAYHVALSDASGSPCGTIRLPATMTLGWVDRLLGGTPPTEGEAQEGLRKLSPLESDLMLDLVGAMAQAMAAVSKQAGGPEIRHAAALTFLGDPLPGPDDEELCAFRFMASGSEGGDEITFFIRSGLLEPLADPGRLKKTAATAEENRKHMLRHLETALMEITAEVGTAALTVRDVMALEPGDIVLLNRNVGEWVSLVVGGKEVLQGSPASCKGRYAVKVEDPRQDRRLALRL